MGQLPTKSFDAAKYISEPDDMVDLLNDALDSGHAGYIAKALGVAARAKGMSKLAGETGVNRQALYAALSDEGNPTLDTLVKVVAALGLRIRFETDERAAA